MKTEDVRRRMIRYVSAARDKRERAYRVERASRALYRLKIHNLKRGRWPL